MKKLLFLALSLLCVAAKPGGGGGGSGGWRKADTNLSRWTYSTLSTPAAGDIATCPITTVYANYTAFLVTNITGNISGKTITATFTVGVVSGDPFYVWGGYNYPGGGYGTEAEGRFYFSTHADYPRNGNPSDPDNYWFSSANTLIDDLLGAVTISATVDPSNWAQSFGAWGTDHLAGFNSACQNVTTIGFAFGSNQFSDTGISTTNGTAVIHLQGFTVQ